MSQVGSCHEEVRLRVSSWMYPSWTVSRSKFGRQTVPYKRAVRWKGPRPIINSERFSPARHEAFAWRESNERYKARRSFRYSILVVRPTNYYWDDEIETFRKRYQKQYDLVLLVFTPVDGSPHCLWHPIWGTYGIDSSRHRSYCILGYSVVHTESP